MKFKRTRANSDWGVLHVDPTPMHVAQGCRSRRVLEAQGRSELSSGGLKSCLLRRIDPRSGAGTPCIQWGSPRWLLALICLLIAVPAFSQDETPLARLFDTGTTAAQPLTTEVLAPRAGWQLVPEDKADHRFSGDAVLMNDKLVLVFRKQGRGPEVYAITTRGLKERANLGYAAERALALSALEAFRIVENTSGGVVLEATFKNGGTRALRFRLTAGEAILEIRPTEGTGFLEVQSRTRHVIVPDYFGDDMIYQTAAFSGLCLPAENICLNLIDGGDAIVMSVWQAREQDVWLAATQPDREAGFYANRIRCLKDQAIWLAFLESPSLWHGKATPAKDGWKAPFPAKWRASFVRDNAVADSWDAELEASSGLSAGKHQGPLLIYPIDRSTATPLTATCPTDVMRNTLGVGPCQYILACEGLAAQGDPTPNSVMGWVEKEFEQKKDKKVADDIRERLQQMVQHVTDARSRIERYVEFAAQLRKALAGKQGSEQFRAALDDLERFAAGGLGPESSPERARQLAGEVSALVGKENMLTACQRLGEQIRSIGAVQDRALAKGRMTVRRLGAQGRTIAANQPSEAGLAQEVQRLAEQTLKNK